ncbi:hypothetical protein WME94_10965 [Sorangium sp. So ce429]
MPTPRQVLDRLSRNELLALADAHRLIIGDRRVKAHIADRIEMTGPPMLELLAGLSRDRLAELCRLLGLDGGGRAKAPLITRLAGSSQQALAFALSSPGAAVSPPPRPPPRGTLSNMDQATHNRIVSLSEAIKTASTSCGN